MNREYLNFAQNQPNVMSDEKTLTVDLEKVIRDKNPALARLLPRFVVAYLKRTIHQDEINRILQAYSHLEPIPFIRAALADMGIRYRAGSKSCRAKDATCSLRTIRSAAWTA